MLPSSEWENTVRLTDRIECLMWAGAYEPELRTILKNILQSGMTFVDVGVHIGYFTVLAAHRGGASGEVHAFEPDPVCFQRLRINTADYDYVHAYHVAVSNEAGKQDFFDLLIKKNPGRGQFFLPMNLEK